MKKIIVILIFLVISGCLNSSPYLAQNSNLNMSIEEFERLAKESGCEGTDRVEYKGYTLVIAYHTIGYLPTNAIFNPSGKLIKLIKWGDEGLRIGTEDEQKRYLRKYVAERTGTKDYNELYDVFPEYIVIQMERKDQLAEEYISSSRIYNYKFDQWLKDYKEYEQREAVCLNSLSDKQLELLSVYQETSVKNQSKANTELAKRRLLRSLSDEQKESLIYASNIADDLNERKAKLMQEEAKIKALDEEIEKLNKSISTDVNNEISQLNERIAYHQANRVASQNNLNQYMYNMQQQSYQRQQGFYQRQQQWQMMQMNNSLQDISRALRGY